MAGDWIKMRMDLHTHPKVVRIMSATKSDKFRVIGGLHAVWGVFDQHSEDGRLVGYTPELMDMVIGWSGFSEAMIAVGWMVQEGPEVLVMPDFDNHNGKSAKRRAEDTARKRESRKSPKAVRNVSAKESDKDTTREEKRREDNNTPLTPRSGGHSLADRFQRFWDAYPVKKSKGAAEKAFAKTKPDDLLLTRMLKAIRAQTEHRERMRAAGQFVPEWKHPSTWLNQLCWEDELEPIQQQPQANGTNGHQPAPMPRLRPFPQD